MKKIYQKRKFIYILIILALIIYSFRVVTIFDEDYSIVLINKSLINIIRYDSLDVHPPLFYILLKFFLNITTFWTNSFIIKIVFARLFSIIISIIIIIYLIKISSYIHVNINKFFLIISFLIIPGVISFTYEFIKIRMYSLSALWTVIILYELLKFQNDKSNKQLIIIGCLQVFNEYTNYYSALISFLFISLLLVKCFINKNKIWTKILFLLIIVILVFIPWLPLLFKQISLSVYHPLPGGIFKQWIATLIFINIFIYPLYWSFNHVNKKFFDVFFQSFIILIFLFIFMSVFSIIYRPVFQFRYLYPVYIIYSFFATNIIFIMLSKYKNRCKIFIPLVILIFLIVSCIGSYTSQILYYNMASVRIISQFNYFKNTKKHFIYLRSVNNVDDGFNLEKVIYLSRIHKIVETPNIKEIFNNPSYKYMFNDINNHLRS